MKQFLKWFYLISLVKNLHMLLKSALYEKVCHMDEFMLMFELKIMHHLRLGYEMQSTASLR